MKTTRTEKLQKADNINYLDGDIESQMGIKWNNTLEEDSTVDKANVNIDKWNKNAPKYLDGKTGKSNEMYAYAESSLITDRARVYKGGSWKDRGIG